MILWLIHGKGKDVVIVSFFVIIILAYVVKEFQHLVSKSWVNSPAILFYFSTSAYTVLCFKGELRTLTNWMQSFR